MLFPPSPTSSEESHPPFTDHTTSRVVCDVFDQNDFNVQETLIIILYSDFLHSTPGPVDFWGEMELKKVQVDKLNLELEQSSSDEWWYPFSFVTNIHKKEPPIMYQS